MPLPKVVTPQYTLVIPSLKKEIKYRPFLVKEEKILIIAQESEDPEQIANAVKTVINNCILTRGIKIEQLATFDIEYLFLNIRGKSVGETIEFLCTCPDDEETKVPVSINLDEIQVHIDEDHSRDIKLDDKLTLRMKYPSMSDFIKTNFAVTNELSVTETFDLIISCIEQVYSEEESWTASDCTKKELEEFIENLSPQKFKEIDNFFNTMPKLLHKFKVKNPKTGVEREVKLEGLQSFFA
jgi:hypothetical protein